MRGFTLLELIVVLAILIVLAVAAIPASAGGDGFPLDMAEIRVADACDWARRLAASQRRAHGVVFDLAGDRLAVVQEDGVEAVEPLTRKAYIVPLGQDHGVDLLAADFGATGTVLVFDAAGVPVEGGTLRMAKGGAGRLLVVGAATGEVERP